MHGIHTRRAATKLSIQHGRSCNIAKLFVVIKLLDAVGGRFADYLFPKSVRRHDVPKALKSEAYYTNPPQLSSTPLRFLISYKLILGHSVLFTFETTIMSTLEDLDDMEREEREEKGKKKKQDGKKESGTDGDVELKDAPKEEEEEEEEILDEDILHSSTREIQMRKRLLENDLRIMKSEYQRLSHEQAAMKEKIKDNLDKIENNRFVV